jgi:hypothetical protein
MAGKVGRPSKRSSAANRAAVMDALARGLTYDQAAKEAGVAQSTVTRYLAEPVFRQELRERSGDALEAVTRMLAARSVHAVNVLTREMVESPHASTRVRAAMGILVESRAWSEARISDLLAEVEGMLADEQTTQLRAVK